jgi:hypothetical protein
METLRPDASEPTTINDDIANSSQIVDVSFHLFSDMYFQIVKSLTILSIVHEPMNCYKRQVTHSRSRRCTWLHVIDLP